MLAGIEVVDGYRHLYSTQGSATTVSFLNPIRGSVPQVGTLTLWRHERPPSLAIGRETAAFYGMRLTCPRGCPRG